MDMWQPYFQTIRRLVADGDEKIVFDRFHVVGHMNKAVDQVRRSENKELREVGDDTLVGTKHLWLYGAERLAEEQRVEFVRMRDASYQTARAWSMKEMLRGLWDCPSAARGTTWWKHWYYWATHSKLVPVKKVAEMIRSHLPNILSYFRHRITNAASESINSVIQLLKKRAFGYRSFANFRTAVFFRCGGLELYPAPT